MSDVLSGEIYKFDLFGNKSLFANDFVGKGNPPAIGPTGMIFDSYGNLYVGDGDNIWRFTSIAVAVSEPSGFLLFLAGFLSLMSLRYRNEYAQSSPSG